MADLIYAAILEKFPGEQFTEDFDFNGFIPESTTVVTASVTVTKNDGTDATDTIYKSKTISGTVVSVVLYTSTADAGYTVSVSVVASDTSPCQLTKLVNVTTPGVYR